MKSTKYVLPDVTFPRLKKVIKTFFLANELRKTVLTTKDLVAFSCTLPHKADQISAEHASGSVSFLCDLGILEQTEKSKFKLTGLGLELGKSLNNNDASNASLRWSNAMEHSPFLVELFREVKLRGEIDNLKLRDIIVSNAGRKHNQAANRGARTIIDIWENAQKIKKQDVRYHELMIQVNRDVKAPPVQVLPDDLKKLLARDFKTELADLEHNFEISGTCTAFLLRKILEKLIFLVFAKNGLRELLYQDNDKIIGLNDLLNQAKSRKINDRPILTSKTADKIQGLKFLGDLAAHDPYNNVEMELITPQMPYIITAYKELASKL